MGVKLNLTLEQTIHAHRFMWNWIADETEAWQRCIPKKEFFRAFGIPERYIPSSFCYCCDYAIGDVADPFRLAKRTDCFNCPIKWDNGFCSKSTFKYWYDAFYDGDWKRAAFFARQIADLPER